jgi:hypothetical protein
MRWMSVVAVVLALAACGRDEVIPDARPIDATPPPPTPDAATACEGSVDVATTMLGCGCCSEGTQACVNVTVSADGVVSAVDPGTTATISEPALDCVRAAVVDACLVDFAGQVTEVCTFGV